MKIEVLSLSDLTKALNFRMFDVDNEQYEKIMNRFMSLGFERHYSRYYPENYIHSPLQIDIEKWVKELIRKDCLNSSDSVLNMRAKYRAKTIKSIIWENTDIYEYRMNILKHESDVR